MDAEINNVIYMEINSGPKIANSTCGKTIYVETIDRDSTVVRKLGSASSRSIIMAAHKIGLLTTESTKKHKANIPSNNLGQYRYCLVNGILHNVAPLQMCGCEVIEILLHMHSKLV